MQFIALLITKKWNNLKRKFLNNVSPLKLSLGKLRLLSGLTEMPEEQSVSQQTWSWALMWPETIASEHLVLLVAVIKNHCHWGCHSSWYVVWDAVQWCCCQRRVTLCTVWKQDYTKNFQNYSQFLKILSILIIYFPTYNFHHVYVT